MSAGHLQSNHKKYQKNIDGTEFLSKLGTSGDFFTFGVLASQDWNMSMLVEGPATLAAFSMSKLSVA